MTRVVPCDTDVKLREPEAMNILLDIAVIFVVLICVIVGYKRGFIKTVIGIIGCFAAILLSYSLSKLLSELLYNTFLKASVESAIQSQLPVIKAATTVADVFAAILACIPGVFAKLTELFGITAQSAIDIAESPRDALSEASPEALANTVVKPAVTNALSFILLFLLFIIFTIVFRWIGSRLSASAANTRGIDVLNGVLGSMAGVVKAALIMLFITAVLGIYMSLSGSDFALKLKDAVDKTVILRFIFLINPIASY